MDILVNSYQTMLGACKMTGKNDTKIKDESMSDVDDLTLNVQTQNLVYFTVFG